MQNVEKETQIKIIKSMLKRRIKAKGMEGVTEKWINDKAEEIYKENPNGIRKLEGQNG